VIDPQRFWSRVAVGGPDDCWLWLGARTSAGYGHLRIPGDRAAGTFLAHRVAHELEIGPIGRGLVVDHLCETPLCVNPAHLEAVCDAVNVTRVTGKRTECLHGHPLDGLRRQGDGHGGVAMRRYCKTCLRLRSRARRRARAEER
jgi:hypothetical protein